jgi:hypothetical protein
MRYVLRFLVGLGLLLLLVASLSAFIVSEWRRHFFNLLSHSWELLMAASSSSTFGLLYYSIGAAVLSGGLSAVHNFLSKERIWDKAFKEAIPQFIIGLIVVPILALLAFSHFVVRTVYLDHQSLVAAIAQQRLRQTGLVDPKSRDDEIFALKGRLSFYEKQQSSEVRVYPLSPGTRDPNAPRMEYILASGKIRTPADIGITCNFAIANVSWTVLTTTGSTSYEANDQRISEKQYRIGILSPAWTPHSPVYVTVFFVRPVNQMPSCSFNSM